LAEKFNTNTGRRRRKGYAEEIQKRQKIGLDNFYLGKQALRLISVFAFFCVFCVTFASSASGILVFGLQALSQEKTPAIHKVQQAFLESSKL
jgi:hypothetical protein